MASVDNPRDDPDDVARLAAVAAGLADAIELALPAWVERSVERVASAWSGLVDDAVRAAAADAGRRAAVEVAAEVRALLRADVDDQRANPLALLRRAVRFPTAVLTGAGVPPVVRSEFDMKAFPDDDYGLAPATWADIDPSLHERGIMWGAAKAHVVLARRRREGRR